MPIYACTTQQGALTQEQRNKIAAGITEIHCRLLNAPPMFVHVLFTEMTIGWCFSGAEPSRVSMVRASIREGRTFAMKHKLMDEISQFWTQVTGVEKNDLLVSLTENPGANAMEFGLILPEPKDDDKWLIENGFKKGVKA